MVRFHQCSALALAMVLGAHPLWADVTPEDVWKNWQDSITSDRQKLTIGSEAREGDTLVIKGITLTMQDKMGTRSSAHLDEMRLKDNGDGTVAVVLPDSFPLQLSLPSIASEAGGVQQDVTLTIASHDAKIIASGVPEAVNYQSDIGSVDVATTVAKADGTSTTDIAARLTGLSAAALSKTSASGKDMTETFTAKSFDLTAGVKTAVEQSNFDIKLGLSDFGGRLVMTGIPNDDTQTFETMMKSGLSVDMALTYGAGMFAMTGQDAGKPIKVSGGLGGGGFKLSLDGQTLHYDIANTSVSLDMAGTDSTSGQDFTLTAGLADFVSKLDTKGMVWSDSTDFAAALKAGLQMEWNVGLGASSLDFERADGAKPVRLNASTAGVNLAFAVDKQKMHMTTGAKAVSATVMAPNMPVPEVSADLGELAVDLAMPVAKSDIPAPFAFVTRIVDLKLAEAVWSMFDPAGDLPHDPASLIIDTKGTATLTKDLLDNTLDSGTAATPVLLNALDLSQLNLKVAGAEVSAQGGLTFDNSDMTTFPGAPAPTGKVDIKATGLNGLIDTLVKMGLVPRDRAMQGRMMLAMFANTSTTADEMTSALEFKDKHFFVNGQQLQ
ncbi:MAG: DUF2125 domain-containing protein [Cypionkella sp.]